ncbi:hypothetical protein C8A05DRAFT_29518 [Staphylotrichum tortipilum]|uniref:Protein kinase domain-containing protein n=1 Tax=Staphylotrichum tortipilum TaxID=2831512 RepID=A0AAN6MU11_9PEZI|nr:hypothetical protein C8A05DRAFT_29518 [Staphylotrichum longicolle]
MRVLGDEDCMYNYGVGKPLPALKTTECTTVDFTNLARFEQLGGKGCATLVRLRDEPDRDGGDGTVRDLIRYWHDADNLLHRIPPHPNIMPPPTTFVTIGFGDNPPVVCGGLQPFYPGRDVGERLEESNRRGEHLPLALKAHWCANMAATIAHVYRVAHTYHMDIKPGNVVIDRNSDLVLCDWEQSDAPPTTLAPEADGTWDVEVVVLGGDGGRQDVRAGEGDDNDRSEGDGPAPRVPGAQSRLVYTKYHGPSRRNTEEEVGDASWHQWNVFPLWNAECPLALEPAMDFDEIEHPNDLATDWDGTEDIPELWRGMVDRCMAEDPNERPDVVEVVRFWENARDD